MEKCVELRVFVCGLFIRLFVKNNVGHWQIYHTEIVDTGTEIKRMKKILHLLDEEMRMSPVATKITWMKRKLELKYPLTMYNGGSQWNQASWSQTYYHQYMQQHTRLTQWLQQIHHNTSSPQHPCTQYCSAMPQNNCCGGPQNNCAARSNCHAPAVNMGRIPPVNMGHMPPVNMGYAFPINNMGHYYPAVNQSGYQQEAFVPAEYSEDKTEEFEMVDEVLGDDSEDDEAGDEAEDDSEGELIFNVDAILEMRATREISDRDSEDSFELLDSVKDDMKEYTKMDAYGNVQNMKGKLESVNMYEEELNRKGGLRMLYGNKDTTIGGMETSMAVQFDHIYDTLQPTLWPVLPLLL